MQIIFQFKNKNILKTKSNIITIKNKFYNN